MVTVQTVLSPAASRVRSRTFGVPGRAVALPCAAVLAALTALAAEASSGRLSWTVVVVALGWPPAAALVAGRAPAAGPLAAHHRRAVLRSVVVVAVAHLLLSSWVSVDTPSLVAAVAALAAVTLATAALLSRAEQRGGVRPSALVVGEQADLRLAMSQVAVAAGRHVDVVGGCTPDELAGCLDQLRPDIVLTVPSPRLSGRVLQRLAWQLERGHRGHQLPMLLLTGLGDVRTDRTRALTLGGLGVTELLPAAQVGARGAVKVVWERAAAAGALLALAPVLLLLAVLIRLDSPGPVLFRQVRVGRDGRPFTMLKLRTMRTDAEAVRHELANDVDGALFKVRQDPRVTRVGRILRRYSLDELPQLVNVVRGEMSLVGPRPALPSEVAAYDDDPRRRLVVRPGLTGLWQISGRSDLSWREAVRLDLDYVDNWTLRRDLAIVGRTLQAVLGHRGAY